MSTTCGNNGTVTITDSAQALSLSSCTTYIGSISVDEHFSGDLVLNSIKSITGNIFANHVLGLASLSAELLQTVGGTIQINGSYLTALSLPVLLTAHDKIDILSTSLESLQLSSLNTTDSLVIQNNTNLTNVNLSNLRRADEIAIAQNGLGRLKLNLSSLEWATHLIIHQCSSVDLASLASTGDATFYANTFSNLSFPALTAVKGGLTIIDNTNLTSITASSLATIELPGDATYQNALNIFGNSALTGTIEFPAVGEIKHNADVSGAFSEFLLPALTTFNGNLTIESTKDIASTCVYFDDIRRAHVTIDIDAIKCIYPSAHNSSGRTKAIAGGIGGAVGVCVILGLLFLVITFRKIRGKATTNKARGPVFGGEHGIELPNYGSLTRATE